MTNPNPDPAPGVDRDSDGPDLKVPAVQALLRRYWRRNLMLMAGLLLVWAAAGLGCGVLFADVLNQFHLYGYPLGFWFAQQGSIIIFVLLILVYCLAMNVMDARHHRELEQLKRPEPS